MEFPPLILGGKFAAVIRGPGRVGFSGAHTVASRSRIYPGTAASSVPHDEYNTAIFENQYVIHVCNITVTKRPASSNSQLFIQFSRNSEIFQGISSHFLPVRRRNPYGLLLYMCNSLLMDAPPSGGLIPGKKDNVLQILTCFTGEPKSFRRRRGARAQFSLLHFPSRCAISNKESCYSAIRDERENNDSALPREDGPPAASLSAERRLVRPGAAVETRPEAHRYRGQSARRQARIRVVPRRGCLSSQLMGRRAFLYSKRPCVF